MIGNASILVIDRDAHARAALVMLLNARGYNVSSADGPQQARAQLERQRFDLVIAEATLPEAGNSTVLSLIDTLPEQPALIILTGRPSLESAITAINGKADAYLIKPCNPEELLAQVAAALRRRAEARRQRWLLEEIAAQLRSLEAQIRTAISPAAPAQPANHSSAEEPVMYVGILQIGPKRHNARAGDKPMPLTPIEHRLLRCLAEAKGAIRSYSSLVERIHGYKTSNEEAAALLKSHARNLRRKLPPGYLITVRDTGYILADPATRQQDQAASAAAHTRYREVGASQADPPLTSTVTVSS